MFIFLGPSNVLFKHMDKLCQVFDKVLTCDLKDEYEMASNALESLLYNLCHMRPLQNYYTGKLVGYLPSSSFVRFVEEIDDPKNLFEIKCPLIPIVFKRSHSVSERFYISICPSVRASVRASVPKPQFHYLHNQELCQFTSDWLLMSATGILIKILAI